VGCCHVNLIGDARGGDSHISDHLVQTYFRFLRDFDGLRPFRISCATKRMTAFPAALTRHEDALAGQSEQDALGVLHVKRSWGTKPFPNKKRASYLNPSLR
jgi:hypothetical protein